MTISTVAATGTGIAMIFLPAPSASISIGVVRPPFSDQRSIREMTLPIIQTLTHQLPVRMPIPTLSISLQIPVPIVFPVHITVHSTTIWDLENKRMKQPRPRHQIQIPTRGKDGIKPIGPARSRSRSTVHRGTLVPAALVKEKSDSG